MKSKSSGKVKAILTALTFLAIFAALYVIGAGGIMLLVGALHSAVPAVPAISFVGSGWLLALAVWFRILLATPKSA
ncbi:hypothetical protein ACIP6P_00640 [Streptomyces sp. NPDC088729]|uniref:hypothetical protein n=1 Tax=Streptomyces sp. NPDC088729 TaxID=3365876 RepID=UPI003804040E